MKPDRSLRRIMACGALTLAACASPPRLPADAGWTSGRLSLRVEATADQAARGFGASFELRGDGQQGELVLQSTLGIQLATARWSPGAAVLITPQGEQAYPSLDELSRQALGEPLPLAALPSWLAGQPWPGAAHRWAEPGFQQLGWSIDLGRHAEGWISARRDTPPAVLLRVKLDLPQARSDRS